MLHECPDKSENRTIFDLHEIIYDHLAIACCDSKLVNRFCLMTVFPLTLWMVEIILWMFDTVQFTTSILEHDSRIPPLYCLLSSARQYMITMRFLQAYFVIFWLCRALKVSVLSVWSVRCQLVKVVVVFYKVSHSLVQEFSYDTLTMLDSAWYGTNLHQSLECKFSTIMLAGSFHWQRTGDKEPFESFTINRWACGLCSPERHNGEDCNTTQLQGDGRESHNAKKERIIPKS